MTRIILSRDKGRFTVSAQGHATGSVETCASISTILYALANYLNNSDLKVFEERLEEGNAAISFSGDDKAETVFDFVSVGFLQLQAARPDCVAVQYKKT